MNRWCKAAAAGLMLLRVGGVASKAAEIPDAMTAPGEAVLLRVHAEGAQIYQCTSDNAGHFVWQFREPIASLFSGGATVGRHYAGPTWEIGGSAAVGKAVARVRGATAQDIPWLRLDVVERHGDGPLKDATAVQRINTRGGNLEGRCQNAAALRAVA
ncbi:MAG: DUF3455 domain-containing protein, partial [Alphaproteobacteria bacterium]|nr:DUF3455 domain-containing protein [Alphaproteobacteria bacterium]